MKLTTNFTLEELTFSQTASRLGIDNTPNSSVIDNLRELCQTVLEPLRARLGKAIVISSGYRCSKLNDVVRGAYNSAHMSGHAADIQVAGYRPTYLMAEVVDCSADLPLKQVILEYPPTGWVHVAFDHEADTTALLIRDSDGYRKWVHS